MERATMTGVASRAGKKARIFAGPLAWLWLLAFCTGTGIAALLWLTTIPPLPECKMPQSLSLDADRLFCVEQTAQAGDAKSLIAGIDLVKDWSADHPLYSRSRQLLEKWSGSLLELARVRAVEADLTGAIALAQKIPPTSPIYKDAKAAVMTWQKDLKRGQTVVASIQAAMRARQWGVAMQQIRTLAKTDSDYWLQQVDRLRQQVSAEQIAADQLEQARKLVKQAPGNLEALGRAIALAEQINPDTYAATAAKTETQRWMEALYGIVAGRLSPKTDLAGATAAVQQLPRGIPIPNVNDILWFSRAQPLVTDPLPRGQLPWQLWQLWLVSYQVRQIPPDSPLYSQTKTLLPKLHHQIQDVNQLNLANAFAGLGQIPGFQLAIQVAQGIAPSRPRRIYAQTLITMWQKDIERVQDNPYLVQAQQYAATGSPEALKQAIAYAGQIAPGRRLYPDAKEAIDQWNRQIQLIEDEPILKRAQAFAKQQRLNEAMQTAAKIRPGRVLYREAQTAIAGWVYEIQVAEDQPLLDRANALAEQGNLVAAINLAEQIRPGRALSGAAQRAIATWAAQQKARQPEPKPLDDLDPEPSNSSEPPAPLPSSDPLATPTPFSTTPDPTPHTPHPTPYTPSPPPTPAPNDYPVDSEALPAP